MTGTHTKKMNRMIVSVLRQVAQAGEAPQQAPRPKSRVGKKTVAGHFDPAVAWQLRKLALDRNTTVQKLLEEALDDLFGKYHLPGLT